MECVSSVLEHSLEAGRMDDHMNGRMENDGGAPYRYQLSCSIQSLSLNERHISASRLDDLKAHNRDCRRLLSRKILQYFKIRDQSRKLHRQNVVMTREIDHIGQALGDTRRQLAREKAAAEKRLGLRVKEVDDLRLALSRASQKIQRRLRMISLPGKKEHTEVQMFDGARTVEVPLLRPCSIRPRPSEKPQLGYLR
ncbi:hypothetical protein L227DRAFT_560285 [Lentinus tigrinus ALCF2SS1-6]|uniref:Uncharacterized protein n=1 Tax=Lentinus tigrinus ALCF2SS1-6 TaxID=1328759 RepID=A0A5C2SR05_9APHY|nr:hypothetical protein L227DRAFT_560285 [Lentinus tigrinus ALCF2SS1-6]